jgi:hypothetical protein
MATSFGLFSTGIGRDVILVAADNSTRGRSD